MHGESAKVLTVQLSEPSQKGARPYSQLSGQGTEHCPAPASGARGLAHDVADPQISHRIDSGQGTHPDWGFDPQSAHPREGNQLMFLSQVSVSLPPPALSSFPSLFLSSMTKRSGNILLN